MRSNMNKAHVEGYVYDTSKLTIRESGPASKNPGTVFIMGDLDVATDEQALNVVSIHFTYVTEYYSKSGKINNTFTALKRLIDAPEKTWLNSGKEGAAKISVDGNLGLNDFYAADGSQISAKRMEGSFLSFVNEFSEKPEDRNSFKIDMVITRVTHVDANPEKNIPADYVIVAGAAFNFRNDLLPIELVAKSKGAMKYFEEDNDISGSNPLYTNVRGRIISQTIKIEREEESAFGEPAVTTYERKNREWEITSAAKVPYEYGEEDVMTNDDVKAAMQNREVMLADLKKRNEEYLASKNNAIAASASTPVAATPVSTSPFNF